MKLEIIRHDAKTGKMLDSLPLHVAGRHVAEHCYEWDAGSEFKSACRKARIALDNKIVFRVGSYVYANRQLFNVPNAELSFKKGAQRNEL